MTSAHLPGPSRQPSDTLRRRSVGLRRVHGVTRWTLIGSAASALVLGLGYGHALPDPAALLPTHITGNAGDGTGGGGVQAPAQPGLGAGGSHTSTGAS